MSPSDEFSFLEDEPVASSVVRPEEIARIREQMRLASNYVLDPHMGGDPEEARGEQWLKDAGVRRAAERQDVARLRELVERYVTETHERVSGTPEMAALVVDSMVSAVEAVPVLGSLARIGGLRERLGRVMGAISRRASSEEDGHSRREKQRPYPVTADAAPHPAGATR